MKPPVLRTILRVKFCVGRAGSDWNGTLAILRAVAGEPDYCGPDLGLLERVAADIAAVQAQVRDWPRRLCGGLLDR
jgi:hypothetical protein